KGASDLGLIPGIPVFGGMIDVPAAAAGCGCLKEKDAHIYLGTSGWLSALLREPVELSEGAYLIPSIDPDLMIYGGCTNACCKMLNWAIDHFYSKEHEEMGSKVFDLINKEASGISAGSDGLYATPWLFGEQFPVCDPNARAMFFNINEKHSRAHFINAVMESICFSMKGQLELLKKDAGFTPEVLGADGGGSLSDHWMQMMADVLQIPVRIPENTRHSGALGAALAAAIGLGWCTFDDAGSLIHTEKEFLPRPEYKDLYESKYENYKMIYEMSKEMFSRLNAE
ncbi:MAG: hypothetical protein IJK95_03960, partial [Firmicutes bacterium]|nr:hypothetical protein [Bacillota bacterium]